ncbi:MAG TPA: GNAT family N-acetyltransferase [Longimicrobium sp.]|nr:GNAT family N-acetyltransferase [Longimicrobium sp.]
MSEPAVRVAPLDHRDPQSAERIHGLQQAAYAVERDLLGVVDFYPLTVTAEEIRREDEVFLGAWEGDRLVGAVSFAPTPEGLHVGRLVVDPARFRRGIAARLLDAVERSAAPGERLTVSTAARNEPAVRLYRKHGFEIVERAVLPGGLALVRLAKDVAA